jgi:hypothetical protein
VGSVDVETGVRLPITGFAYLPVLKRAKSRLLSVRLGVEPRQHVLSGIIEVE